MWVVPPEVEPRARRAPGRRLDPRDFSRGSLRLPALQPTELLFEFSNLVHERLLGGGFPLPLQALAGFCLHSPSFRRETSPLLI